MVKDIDMKPDHVTFVALISACSHADLVEEGLKYYEAMSKEYGIVPTEENYGSVVDLLARAGHLDEAKNFIANMPIEPGANVWGALLGASKLHGNVKDAEHAAKKLHDLEPREGGFRKLLSSVYSDNGSLDFRQSCRG
ncbi:Pentatricopeptide repeat-containing protein [Thalictrum thalictroides]|uniref:Pentatricopeptide repeat-containing protein n=1 Tax=Thalictrum thalictroides TaxID=46969 RepID=A0A7J6V1M0_THATH|nr:Pentatricopeptide repeat-containing protein [Thalictrum thalictroides]